MILKALYDYYQRCGDLAPFGMEYKEIGFLIVIKKDGTFVRIESRMNDKKTADIFLVPKAVDRSGKKYNPNYFWDKLEYIVGDGGNDASLKKQLFVNMVNEYAQKLPQNEEIKAISNFYSKYPDTKQILSTNELYKYLEKSNKNISFLLERSTRIIAENDEIINCILKSADKNKDTHLCLVTGEYGIITRLHSKIKLKISKDASPLISFQKNSGYDSYGKEQGYNAPINEQAEFAYSTALNHLASNERNNYQVCNRAYIFWASSNNEAAQKTEESLFDLLGFVDDDEKDDPNSRIENVREVFKSINTGKIRSTLDDKFYILGLTLNAHRQVVTYWSETSLRNFAEKILRHFDDMDIGKSKRSYMGLNDMLGAVTLSKKHTDAAPNLSDAVAKSIFLGYPYPHSLFSAAIRRIRAEQNVTYYGGPCRIAIIKAYLNRLNDNNKKIEIMLDKDNTNLGYLCGRLFAVLEKIQEEANNINSIRERYLNAASATPSLVFATILNLSFHHIEKLNTGRKVSFEKIEQEIIDKMPADGFPAHLNLQDQGRFFVGYYHQRQDLFTKKEEIN